LHGAGKYDSLFIVKCALVSNVPKTRISDKTFTVCVNNTYILLHVTLIVYKKFNGKFPIDFHTK